MLLRFSGKSRVTYVLEKRCYRPPSNFPRCIITHHLNTKLSDAPFCLCICFSNNSQLRLWVCTSPLQHLSAPIHRHYLIPKTASTNKALCVLFLLIDALNKLYDSRHLQVPLDTLPQRAESSLGLLMIIKNKRFATLTHGLLGLRQMTCPVPSLLSA